MKPARLAALLALLASAAAAPHAPRGGFSTKSFGEGGGYKHPDAATGQYLEEAPRQDPRPSPRIPSHRETSVAPVPARIAPTDRGVVTRAVAPSVSSPVAPHKAPQTRVSLWSGLVQPLDMPAAQAGVSDPDEASERGRRDYESHILGQREPAPRPRSAGVFDIAKAGGGAAAADEHRLFVSLELDPREAGSLRDAVAGLGSSVGFTADARFQPLAGPSGTSMISGWLPASQLGLAVSQRGVKRVRVETTPRPAPAREISGEFLIGLRLEDSSQARQAVEAGVRALASTAGFRLTRVVGLETAPDGRVVAVIAGLLPLSRLSKAMDRSEVVKITPLSSSSVPLDAEPERPARARGFARFVVERGLWLLLITFAMALPILRRGAGRALSILVPYR